MQSLLRALTLGSVLAIAGPAASLSAQTADRAIGTWKLDVAKSRYDLGPMPKSLAVTYAMAGAVLQVSTKGVDAHGNPTTTGYTASYDGKDNPAMGAPGYDTVSLMQVDASTVQITRKKGGKVVATVERVVSADGKVLTITTTGTNAKGQPARDVGVFEKQ